VQEIDFLFNNGEGNIGNQAVDVDNVSSDYCFRIANPWWPTGYYLVYPTECETQPQPQPQGMTIRLMEEYYYGGWYADNYIYAWQHDDSTGVDTQLLGEWPGQPMEFDGNGWWTYTFAQEYDKVNIVFNSFTHSVQTVDILNVTESSCFQIGEGLGYFDGMYVHKCAQVDCSIAPSMYHIVYFFGLNDSYLGMSRVVEGQAAVAPEAPVVPGYTFVGWDQDFSHVMGQMMVHAVYQYNGGSGDGIKWIGQGVSGGYLETEVFTKYSVGQNFSGLTFTPHFSIKPTWSTKLGVSIPWMSHSGEVQYRSNQIPTDRTTGGMGDVSFDFSKTIGSGGAASLSASLSIPTGQYDIKRGTDASEEILPSSFQKGSGLYSLTLGWDYSRDTDKGIWLYGLTYTHPFAMHLISGENEFNDTYWKGYDHSDDRFEYRFKPYGENDLGAFTPPSVGASIAYGYRGRAGIVQSFGVTFSAPLGVAWISSAKVGV
jgi:hypothetical protein